VRGATLVVIIGLGFAALGLLDAGSRVLGGHHDRRLLAGIGLLVLAAVWFFFGFVQHRHWRPKSGRVDDPPAVLNADRGVDT
jgi:hypothetical protein